MTVMVDGPLTQGDDDVLLDGFLALSTPEGFRAELIDEEIVVSPPPLGRHELCVSRVVRQVLRHSPTEFDFSGNKGLVLPGGEGHPSSHVIPDMTFALAELDLFHDAGSWMPVEADDITMVVEVTSSRPELDRVAKRHGYARAGIPLYLLVDRDEKRVTLFGEPEGDDYRRAEWVPFGKTITLPKPFDVELDTSELV